MDYTKINKEASFFIVRPGNPLVMSEALFIASNYNVKIQVCSNYIDYDAMELVITDDTGTEDFRLCEMAFQGAFHQESTYKCPICADDKKIPTCGHLVFTRPIRAAF